MLLAFFSWWYGPGWKQVADNFLPRLKNIADSFSVSLILPTLFAPWRRIITTPGRNLEARMRAAFDNLFSRAVGFVVRCLVLLAALLCLLVVGLVTLLELIIWPLLPVLIPVGVIAGLAL